MRLRRLRRVPMLDEDPTRESQRRKKADEDIDWHAAGHHTKERRRNCGPRWRSRRACRWPPTPTTSSMRWAAWVRSTPNAPTLETAGGAARGLASRCGFQSDASRQRRVALACRRAHRRGREPGERCPAMRPPQAPPRRALRLRGGPAFHRRGPAASWEDRVPPEDAPGLHGRFPTGRWRQRRASAG